MGNCTEFIVSLSPELKKKIKKKKKKLFPIESHFMWSWIHNWLVRRQKSLPVEFRHFFSLRQTPILNRAHTQLAKHRANGRKIYYNWEKLWNLLVWKGISLIDFESRKLANYIVYIAVENNTQHRMIMRLKWRYAICVREPFSLYQKFPKRFFFFVVALFLRVRFIRSFVRLFDGFKWANKSHTTHGATVLSSALNMMR